MEKRAYCFHHQSLLPPGDHAATWPARTTSSRSNGCPPSPAGLPGRRRRDHRSSDGCLIAVPTRSVSGPPSRLMLHSLCDQALGTAKILLICRALSSIISRWNHTTTAALCAYPTGPLSPTFPSALLFSCCQIRASLGCPPPHLRRRETVSPFGQLHREHCNISRFLISRPMPFRLASAHCYSTALALVGAQLILIRVYRANSVQRAGRPTAGQPFSYASERHSRTESPVDRQLEPPTFCASWRHDTTSAHRLLPLLASPRKRVGSPARFIVLIQVPHS